MPTLLSLFDNQALRVLAEILAVSLAPTVVFVVLRLLGAETRLALARAKIVDLSSDRDRALGELALSRERLAEARQAAGRAQAEIAEREVRLKALAKIQRQIGEPRAVVDDLGSARV